MTATEVEQIVRTQAHGHFATRNDHGISLGQALVTPENISLIVRSVQNGHVTQMTQSVWLVGKEASQDGYRIVMREDGLQFGLASPGFPGDEHLSLTGWYGGLASAFLAM